MSRSRRARHTVTLANGTKKVILSYSASSARDHYERQGHTVVSVEKGDHRRKAQIDAIKSEGRRGTPNVRRVNEVARQLGLVFPVEVKVSARESATLGSHTLHVSDKSPVALRARRPENAGFRHVIKVKSWLPVERMAQVILHELEHARQFENECVREAQTAWDALMLRKRIYNDGTSYKQKRWEREAVAAEARTADFPGIVR